MCGCESWTIKKAERQRIDAFELWCWRKLLRIPWTARRSTQSILKEISPEYSLKGLMLKLKLQYFGPLMRRADSFEKTLMLGKIGCGRRRGRQRMRWFDGITDSMDMSLSKSGSWWWRGRPGVLQCMESQRVRQDWATELNPYTIIFPEDSHRFFFCSISYSQCLVDKVGPTQGFEQMNKWMKEKRNILSVMSLGYKQLLILMLNILSVTKQVKIFGSSEDQKRGHLWEHWLGRGTKEAQRNRKFSVLIWILVSWASAYVQIHRAIHLGSTHFIA